MNQDKIRFLEWLKRRMHHKYGCGLNDDIITNLTEVMELLKTRTYSYEIDDHSLDKIISRYWVDFNLDHSPDINIGFSEKDRIRLRKDIKNIVCDILNKNIPQDFTLKG